MSSFTHSPLDLNGVIFKFQGSIVYESVSINKKDGIEISTKGLSGCHEAIKTRVIRYAIRDVLGDISFVYEF